MPITLKYMCDAQKMLVCGDGHTQWHATLTKPSAPGYQPKGTAVLQKQYWMRSEWLSRASLEYLSICNRMHACGKNAS